MATVRAFHRVAGLIFSTYDMNTGDKRWVTFNAGLEQEGYAHFAIQARGNLKITRPDGSPGVTFSEGMTTADRATLEMLGTYELEALNDNSRHLCVSSGKKGGTYQFQVVRANPQDTVTVPLGTIFALGNGTVTINAKRYSDFILLQAKTTEIQAVADAPCYGLIAWDTTP